MKNIEELKVLAGKYLNRELTPEEGKRLFESLDEINDPKVVDEIFRGEWLKKDPEYKIPQIKWERIRDQYKIEKGKKRLSGAIIPIWKWGAVASVLIAIVAIWWMYRGVDPKSTVYETGFGETEEILLDDGTTVVLNANSRLTWSEYWENSGIRNVELDGEAFFDVAHVNGDGSDQSEVLPFKVRTADLIVNVLGTAFNVSSRRGKTDVFLERGKVELDLSNEMREKETSYKRENDTVIMVPGEFVSFSSRTEKLERMRNESDRGEANWRSGTLAFRNMKFGQILNKLEDNYGKRFEFDNPDMAERRVSLALPYENWETVSKLIEVTLKLKLEENEKNHVIRISKGKE